MSTIAMAPGKTTTLELDALAVAKLRALLKITKNGPIEPFLNGFLRDLVKDELMTGCLFDTEPGYCPVPQHKIPVTKEKIRRIIAGDKRLVHSEPLPRNAVVYAREMDRLTTIADAAGAGKNSILNSLLSAAMDRVDAGQWAVREGGVA